MFIISFKQEQRLRLLKLIGERFVNGDDFERENVTRTVTEVISSCASGENSYRATKCSPSVIAGILHESFIEIFLKVATDPSSSSSSIAYAATILSAIVNYYNGKNHLKGSSSHAGAQSDEEDVCNVAEEDKITFPA